MSAATPTTPEQRHAEFLSQKDATHLQKGARRSQNRPRLMLSKQLQKRKKKERKKVWNRYDGSQQIWRESDHHPQCALFLTKKNHEKEAPPLSSPHKLERMKKNGQKRVSLTAHEPTTPATHLTIPSEAPMMQPEEGCSKKKASPPWQIKMT